jgi:hypothetical protein
VAFSLCFHPPTYNYDHTISSLGVLSKQNCLWQIQVLYSLAFKLGTVGALCKTGSSKRQCLQL